METHTAGNQEWCAILSISCVYIYILHNFQFQTDLDFFKFPPISSLITLSVSCGHKSVSKTWVSSQISWLQSGDPFVGLVKSDFQTKSTNLSYSNTQVGSSPSPVHGKCWVVKTKREKEKNGHVTGIFPRSYDADLQMHTPHTHTHPHRQTDR